MDRRSASLLVLVLLLVIFIEPAKFFSIGSKTRLKLLLQHKKATQIKAKPPLETSSKDNAVYKQNSFEIVSIHNFEKQFSHVVSELANQGDGTKVYRYL